MIFFKLAGEIIEVSSKAAAPVKLAASAATFIGKVSEFRSGRFQKKIERLFVALTEGAANEEEKTRLANFLLSPSDERDKTCAIILAHIERSEEDDKIEIHARLLLNFIAGRMKFSTFKNAELCLEKAYFESLLYLADIAEKGYEYRSDSSIDMLSEAQLYAAGIGYREGDRFTVTQIGRDLYEYGINKSS